jgi:hypothetical protein
MKGFFMEKLTNDKAQIITEVIEIGDASKLTLGSSGTRYEEVNWGYLNEDLGRDY